MSESPNSDPIIIFMEDDLVHTDDHPFCDDPTCGCHESPDLIAQVAHAVADGWLTPQEATHVVAGLLMEEQEEPERGRHHKLSLSGSAKAKGRDSIGTTTNNRTSVLPAPKKETPR